MKIVTEDFNSCLSSVLPLIKGRRYVPILSCLHLSAQGGQLEIRASDGDAFALSRAECSGDLAPICVNAEHIKRLSAVANGVIEINAVKERVILSSTGIADLAAEKGGEFPLFPKEKMTAIGVNVSDLAKGIEGVMWAGLSDTRQMRPVLETIHIQLSEQEILCEATDGRVISQYCKPAIAAKAELLCPLQYARMVVAALNKDGAELLLNEKMICVKSKAGEIFVKQVEGRFPSTDPVVNVQPERVRIGQLPVEDLLNHLQIIQSLCHENEERRVVFEFAANNCTVRFNGQDKYSATLPGKFYEAKLEMRWDCLLAAFACHRAEQVVLYANDRSLMFSEGNIKNIVGLLKNADRLT